MTYAQLISQVIQDLFPFSEAENLVEPHRRQFLQAMSDLQLAVPCLRYGNRDFYKQCGGYFNCGMTVIPAPNGPVTALYTIGKNNDSSTPNGTAVGSLESVVLNMSSLDTDGNITSPSVSGTIASISADGIYSVSISLTNALSALFPANSPQYMQVIVKYVDVGGIQQSVQPAPFIRMSDGSQSGTLSINAKGGTDVTYTATPFNIPQVDGVVSMDASVVTGVSGVSDDDWCCKVYYDQVEYRHIERYMRACSRCNQSDAWLVANAIASTVLGRWRHKRRIPTPTDIGFEKLPPLPPGFHYPQTSTDAGGRSPGGVYAIKHGKIFIAPYIESTESVIVEWNGIKTNWALTDLVTDDPKFVEAVRLLVGIAHYMHYEDNPERLADFKAKMYGDNQRNIPGVQQELIVACREKIRIRTDAEVGSNAPDSAGGIGITTGATSNTGIFYNAAQSYTATCATGQSGNPSKVTVPAGSFYSNLSQADADAQAMASATQQAQAALDCSAGGSNSGGGASFLNDEQQYTAYCPDVLGDTPAAQGNAVTVTIPAGQYKSVVSKDYANAAATAAARAKATAQLACTFYNAPQTAQVTCADTSTESVTIPAGSFTSTDSQVDADQKALAEAQKQATINCGDPVGSYTVGNAAYTLPYSFIVTTTCGQFPAGGTIVIPADMFLAQTDAAHESATRAQLNSQAAAAAQARMAAVRAQAQVLAQSRCFGAGGVTF